jgi:hypothetical protein
MKISELADLVRGIPLCDVLKRYGFEGRTLRAKDAHHNIVVTGSQWFDNKAGVGGGGAIDLVVHLAGVNFSAACRSLAEEFLPLAAGQSGLAFPKSWQEPLHPEKKSFEELAAIYAVREDSGWPIARAYLVEQRKSSPPLVDELHARGSIYANAHRPNPSLVFLHRDQHGKVRGATLRDTRQQSVFRPCLGNKLTAWFVVGDFVKADRIAAVESPIDALSYCSLVGCRGGAVAVVSCAGSSVPRELMAQAYDRREAFVVALDNDPAGQRGRQKTLAHPRLDRARLHPSRRRVLAAPGFGTVANQRNFPDSLGFARPFAPSSPRPAPGSGRNESAVLLCRQHGDHILYQPPTIATGLHYQANLVARPQLLGSQMGGMSGQVMDKEPMLSFPNPAKHVDSRASSGRAFRIADPIHDHLVFPDGHFLGVVIERKSALL